MSYFTGKHYMPVAAVIDSLDPTYDVEVGYREINGRMYIYVENTNEDVSLQIDLTPDSARALVRYLEEAIRSAERERE